jgi:hypothetical protein
MVIIYSPGRNEEKHGKRSFKMYRCIATMLFSLALFMRVIQIKIIVFYFEITVFLCSTKSRDSSVGIALGYRLDDQGSIPGGCWEFFSKPLRPEQLWGPPSLLSNGYHGLFPWG